MTFERTNTTRKHHISGQLLPVVVIHCNVGPAPGEVVYVGGEPLYYACDPCGEHQLCRYAVVRDYGSNEVRRRKAPRSTAGINPNGRYGAVPTRVFFEEPVYWVDFNHSWKNQPTLESQGLVS